MGIMRFTSQFLRKAASQTISPSAPKTYFHQVSRWLEIAIYFFRTDKIYQPHCIYEYTAAFRGFDFEDISVAGRVHSAERSRIWGQ
jgi:hypothetical protein